jgi:hypothetical protein
MLVHAISDGEQGAARLAHPDVARAAAADKNSVVHRGERTDVARHCHSVSDDTAIAIRVVPKHTRSHTHTHTHTHAHTHTHTHTNTPWAGKTERAMAQTPPSQSHSRMLLSFEPLNSRAPTKATASTW